MLTKIKNLFAAHKRAKQQQEHIRLLLDQMRSIEWRLAMCRSCAVDVNAAHAVAFDTLSQFGVEPSMSSASRYTVKRNMS